MRVLFLITILFMTENCIAQRKEDIQFLYQSKYYVNSEVIGYTIYDSKSTQYTVYENLPSSKIDKKVKISLSKNELISLHKLYKSLNLPERKMCIYDNNGKLSGEITITFNQKYNNDILKCFNEENKEKPLLVISQFLKFLKSKKEYKEAFSEEFLAK